MKQPPSRGNNRNDLYRYAGIGAQILAGLALAVFVGLKIDRLLHTLPLFSCALPLLILVGIFYKLTRDTSNKKNNEPE